ncbi:MAG: hypothetical protein KDD42_08650 [Bdellovibrionales bacterium]|nr:hypothetical protein [Bdellovibrionales bacterium]
MTKSKGRVPKVIQPKSKDIGTRPAHLIEREGRFRFNHRFGDATQAGSGVRGEVFDVGAKDQDRSKSKDPDGKL